jgi:hypothetical protein
VSVVFVVFGFATTSRAVIVQPCAGPRSMDDGIGLVVVEGQSIKPAFGENCLTLSETLSSAKIDWGDGTTGAATVVYSVNSDGQTKQAWIEASHAYLRARCLRAEPCQNAYKVTAMATDDQTGARYTWTNFAPVTPAPDVATMVTIHAVSGQRFRGVVAHLHTIGIRYAQELSAWIRWGDGTRSRGRVAGRDRDFDVIAGHHWRRSGHKIVTVTITDTFARTSVFVTSNAQVAPR